MTEAVGAKRPKKCRKIENDFSSSILQRLFCHYAQPPIHTTNRGQSENKPFDVAEIFGEFDTDASGTWSDREIRTLLARMHNLPLYLETVRDFEAKIVNCSRHLPRDVSDPPGGAVPLYERYYDSKLPVVTFALVQQCAAVEQELRSHFRDRRRFRHEVVGDEEVSFKSLTSNVSDVVRALDDLRKAPTKFICINDDQGSVYQGDWFGTSFCCFRMRCGRTERK